MGGGEVKTYEYIPHKVVQGIDKNEAKESIEYRLRILLLHPDGVNVKDIVEVPHKSA